MLILSLLTYFKFDSNLIETTQAASGSFSEDFTTTTYMDGANSNVSGWGTGFIENSKKKPSIVGSISSSLIGNTVDVFVDGDYAYVTNQAEGLKVVDITDPTNPYILGTYVTDSLAESVYVDGDNAFIADYAGVFPHYENFLILNITDPTNPTQLGNCTTVFSAGDAARDAIVAGDTAFVANNQGGLRIIDVSDPTNPSIIGNKDTSGNANSLYIEGNYVYLADGANGLVVINITNPFVPTIVATYSTGISSAINIIVEENLAYVADIINGIVVVNITDPTTPTFAGSWSKSGVSDIYIYDDYLHVTDITDGLSVVNITDPITPVLINTISLPGDTQAIFIEGCYAYIASYDGGFQVVVISDYSTPNIVGSYDTPNQATGVFVSGDYSYIADEYSGLHILDISNPSTPIFIGSYDTPGLASDVFVSGDYAYVADFDVGGLQVIDISNPSSPTFAGFCDTPYWARCVFISDNYAYVADDDSGLQVIDISNPSNPFIAGSYDTPLKAYGVFVSGDYAYVADYTSLQVLDISDPTTPVFIGSYDTLDRARNVFVSGDYAYVADGLNGLQVLNISDPSTPIFVGSYDTPVQATDIFVSDNYAFVADRASGVQVIDISDPSDPTFTSSCDTPGYAYNVFISGNYAYLADLEGGFHILEIRTSSARQFDSSCIAQSNTVFSASSAFITSATLVASGTTPASTSITYSLSADGGTNWEAITPELEHFFSNTGDQFKWKAELTTSDVLVTPLINNLSFDYITTLVAPSLDTPIDGYITDDYTPTFTWSGINGESNYLFQLDTTTSFTTPLLNLTLPSSIASYTPSSPLAVDTYYWRVAGIDSDGILGSFSSYRILYTIQDANPPTINNPNDVSYEQGTTGNSITWIPTDSNPYWYNITLNGILTSHDDPWIGGSIVMDIDGLPLGTHTVVCSVYDLEGLMISDTVEVEVVTTAPPTIDDVADFSYEEDSTGNSITWHPSDTNPDYYSITRDGSVIEDGPWIGGDISINIDGLAYGSYTYVCFVNDTEGQSNSDTVVVTVTDTIEPILNSPSDIIYSEGDTGKFIAWVATDNNPATYIVYKDGTLFDTNTWSSDSSLIISVDGLSSNQYNFTIVVVDQEGNSASDTVIVGVTAAVPEYQMFSIFIGIFVILSLTSIFTRKKKRRDS